MTAVLELQEVLSVDCISHQTPSLELLESLGPQCEVLLHLGSELLRLQVGLGDYAGVLSTAEAGLIGITLLIDWPAAEAAVEAIPHAADIPVEKIPPEDEGTLHAISLHELGPCTEKGQPAFDPCVCLEENRAVCPIAHSNHRHLQSARHIELPHRLLLCRTQDVEHFVDKVFLVAAAFAQRPRELAVGTHQPPRESHHVGRATTAVHNESTCRSA
mmetsp:Transcript_67913/g.147932  ORF Transcript_67913/g.147932 Transcript_67913/m.147932 type:complete len:216 (+) Transcript_67913:319-966(+)